MNKKYIIILIAIALTIALIVLFFFYISRKELTIDVHPENEPNIAVYSPEKEVDFPFEINGRARVFENIINIRVIDEKTKEYIYEGIATANSPEMGEFGDFSKTIDYFYKKPESENLIIEVFWHSPKDGAELDKVSIPVKINIKDTEIIKVFFNNINMDPQISCDKVFPVERIAPHTVAPAKKAIELLLEGISSNEANSGYSTNIGYGVKLQKITIENNTAKVDFDETLESYGGGSCNVTSIRSQITETLKQFPSVKNVIISINGRTDDILQP